MRKFWDKAIFANPHYPKKGVYDFMIKCYIKIGAHTINGENFLKPP